MLLIDDIGKYIRHRQRRAKEGERRPRPPERNLPLVFLLRKTRTAHDPEESGGPAVPLVWPGIAFRRILVRLPVPGYDECTDCIRIRICGGRCARHLYRPDEAQKTKTQ